MAAQGGINQGCGKERKSQDSLGQSRMGDPTTRTSDPTTSDKASRAWEPALLIVQTQNFLKNCFSSRKKAHPSKISGNFLRNAPNIATWAEKG